MSGTGEGGTPAKRTRGRTTARNAGFVFIQTGLPPLLNILLLPILVIQLGDEAYGLFATLTSVFVFSTLFDAGLSKAVVRFVAAFKAKDEVESISRFVSTAFTIYLGIGVIVLTWTVLFAFFGLDLINVPDHLMDEGFLACLVFGFMGLYNFPAGTLGGVMGGIKRHDAESGLHVTVAVTSAGGQAIVALLGGGVLPVVIAALTPQLIKPWVRLVLLRRFLPGFRLSPRLYTRSMLRQIGGYSSWSFLVDSGRRVTESLDPVIIAAFIGLTTVTPYNIGLQVGRLLQRLSMPVAFVLLPVASELQAHGDQASLQRLMLRATRYTSAIAIGLAGPLIVLADEIVRVWLRSEYPLAVDVARIFLCASVILMIRAPIMMILESSTTGVKKAGLWVGVETVLNIALSLSLLQVLDAHGVILSTVIAVVVVSAFGIIPAALKMVGLKAGDFARRSLAPNLRPLAIAVPVWFLISWLVSGAGLIPVLAALVACFAAFFVPFWMTLPPNERADLKPGKIGRRRAGGTAQKPV
jgi:O-antigen/teichoic acid export membrane protein